MITVTYNKPHKFKEGIYLIGYSQTQFEKCKCNIFHRGTYEQAQEKIDSTPGRKYRKR